MDRKREKDGGRVQCFMKMEDTSLIDINNIETSYFNTTVLSSLHRPPCCYSVVKSISVLLLSNFV